MKKIITISREFGSGGREIGEKTAQKLGYKFYDKEIIEKLSEKTGLAKEYISKAGEYAPSKSIFSYAFIARNSNGTSLTDYVYQIQRELILELSEGENCVIVGRCADYALADDPNCVSVFIHAPLEFRRERVKKENKQEFRDDNKINDFINKTDKKRANYYNYYSGKKWGDSRSYHLTIDSSIMGIDKTVDLILEYAKIRFPES